MAEVEKDQRELEGPEYRDTEPEIIGQKQQVAAGEKGQSEVEGQRPVATEDNTSIRQITAHENSKREITESEKARRDIVGERHERARKEIEGPEHKVTEPEIKFQKQQITKGENCQREIDCQRPATTEANNRKEVTVQKIEIIGQDESTDCLRPKVRKSDKNRRRIKSQKHQVAEGEKGHRVLEGPEYRLTEPEITGQKQQAAACEKGREEIRSPEQMVTEPEIKGQKIEITEVETGQKEIEVQRHANTEANIGRREVTAQKVELTGHEKPTEDQRLKEKRKIKAKKQEVAEGEKGWSEVEGQRLEATEGRRQITPHENSKREINGGKHDITEPEKARSDDVGERQERAKRQIEGPEHKGTEPEIKFQKPQIAKGENCQGEIEGQRRETAETNKGRKEVTTQKEFEGPEYRDTEPEITGQKHLVAEGEKGPEETKSPEQTVTEPVIKGQNLEVAEVEKDRREIEGQRHKTITVQEKSSEGQRPKVSKSDKTGERLKIRNMSLQKVKKAKASLKVEERILLMRNPRERLKV